MKSSKSQPKVKVENLTQLKVFWDNKKLHWLSLQSVQKNESSNEWVKSKSPAKSENEKKLYPVKSVLG